VKYRFAHFADDTTTQIATKLHKQFQEDRYLYWSVMCALLQVCTCPRFIIVHAASSSRQANDPATLPAMRIILYKLAHRIVGQSPTPSYKNPDRFYLHLYILRDLESFDEAHTLLESDVGKAICSASLVCNELRRDIWRLRGLWREEGERAQRRIIDDKSDSIWLSVHSSSKLDFLETVIGWNFYPSLMAHFPRLQALTVKRPHLYRAKTEHSA
jgi:N-terminal acetyltransferase B complex non-catalytic subunit